MFDLLLQKLFRVYIMIPHVKYIKTHQTQTKAWKKIMVHWAQECVTTIYPSTKVDPTYRNIRPIYVIEKIFQKLTSTNW